MEIKELEKRIDTLEEKLCLFERTLIIIRKMFLVCADNLENENGQDEL